MENKQTAVELLASLMISSSTLPFKTIDEYIEQAKAMEKEQEFETKAYWFGRGILAGMEGRINELKPTK